MFQYTCLNPIAAVGLDNLTEDYKQTEDFAQADAVLVRSVTAMSIPKLPSPIFTARIILLRGAGMHRQTVSAIMICPTR